MEMTNLDPCLHALAINLQKEQERKKERKRATKKQRKKLDKESFCLDFSWHKWYKQESRWHHRGNRFKAKLRAYKRMAYGRFDHKTIAHFIHKCTLFPDVDSAIVGLLLIHEMTEKEYAAAVFTYQCAEANDLALDTWQNLMDMYEKHDISTDDLRHRIPVL